MSSFLSDHKTTVAVTAAVAVAGSGAVALYSGYRLWSLRRSLHRDNVYEGRRSRAEYLLFHYGSPSELLQWDSGPDTAALTFPRNCAELCIKHATTAKVASGIRLRALDVGCAVGRSTFELTRAFHEVVGIDFSQSFVDTCNQLRDAGQLWYEMTTVGDLSQRLLAEVDRTLNRQKAHFLQGDACALPPGLGQFDLVLAANLICRLHTPTSFFDQLPRLIRPGGTLVITSPYTFMRDFTPRENWVGGWEEEGRQVTGFDGLKRLLLPAFEFVAEENLPFLIRETERKHQWTVAHATVWRRKEL